eukprot:ANDGO_06690.mRNA.1 hypothetical protein
MTGVDVANEHISFFPEQWVNIPPIIVTTIEQIVLKLNAASALASDAFRTTCRIEQDFSSKISVLEGLLGSSSDALKNAQLGLLNELKQSFVADLSVLRSEFSVIQTAAKEDMEASRKELHLRIDQCASSVEKVDQSVKAVDAKHATSIQNVSNRIEGVNVRCDGITKKAEDNQEAWARTVLELKSEDAKCLRVVENLRSVLVGEACSREAALRAEIDKAESLRQQLKKEINAEMQAKLKKELEAVETGVGERFEKERRRELQDLQQMKELFTMNLNKLSDVQKEDLVKLQKDLREADMTLHHSLTKAFDVKMDALSTNVSSSIEKVHADVQNIVDQISEHFDVVQEEHEKAVNVRFASLRSDLISESESREEAIMEMDSKLQIMTETSLRSRVELENMISVVQANVEETKGELEQGLEEKSSQLSHDMQYMQRHLSRMLNENSSSSFARISEARFFALEARIKEEENTRIHETVRLDTEVSKVEDLVAAGMTPAMAQATVNKERMAREGQAPQSQVPQPPPELSPRPPKSGAPHRPPLAASLSLTQLLSPRSSTSFPPVHPSKDLNEDPSQMVVGQGLSRSSSNAKIALASPTTSTASTRTDMSSWSGPKTISGVGPRPSSSENLKR